MVNDMERHDVPRVGSLVRYISKGKACPPGREPVGVIVEDVGRVQKDRWIIFWGGGIGVEGRGRCREEFCVISH